MAINHRIRVLGNCPDGIRRVFHKTLTLPSYLPTGYGIAFHDFQVDVKSPVLVNGDVVIRCVTPVREEAELLREGFSREN